MVAESGSAPERAEPLSAEAASPAFTLTLRHRPIQRRGVQRFEAILNAGRSLLSESGLERFTMEDVATRAGVPVGSVYQYFPNKFALVAEMAAQDTQAIVAALETASVGFPAQDWQDLIDTLLAHMAHSWEADPWRAAVFSAMRSTAATRQRAAENTVALAVAVSKPLSALTPDLSPDQRRRVAVVLVETCQTLLHLTVQDGTLDEETLAEVQRLVRAYLRSVALGTY
jgi:AcrR family transcriptional regulator